MQNKIRLGVIGTGLAWERLHYPAISELQDRYEIAAVCNKTIEKAQAFAKSLGLDESRIYGDYREMLLRPDIDVVDVLVPISENFEVARDVLNAKKHLIAEKPFAATIEGAKELIELKEKYGLNVLVAEQFRYDEGNDIIKMAISEKWIGEVRFFSLTTGADFEAEMKDNTFARKEWRQHPQFKGGIFLDGGVHDIALMRFLFGDAVSVSAYGSEKPEEYCPFSHINAIIKFASGVTGNYIYDAKLKERTKPPAGLRVYGTKGDIFLESKESGMVNIAYADGHTEQRTYTPGRGYYNELKMFAEGNIISTPEKEIGDIELVFKLLNAAENWRG